MKLLSLVSLTLALYLSGCSTPQPTPDEELEIKTEKEIAIEEVCKNVSGSQVFDIYGTRRALSELVHLDGAYMPLLEEMARFISVSLERSGYPKQYPDLQLLKSFCTSLTK